MVCSRFNNGDATALPCAPRRVAGARTGGEDRENHLSKSIFLSVFHLRASAAKISLRSQFVLAEAGVHQG